MQLHNRSDEVVGPTILVVFSRGYALKSFNCLVGDKALVLSMTKIAIDGPHLPRIPWVQGRVGSNKGERECISMSRGESPQKAATWVIGEKGAQLPWRCLRRGSA